MSALGLEVVAVEPWRTGEAIESLDAAGRANQAAAAIRMVASRKGVEVWVANQPTGRSLLRQLIVDERAPAPNEGLVALQTAELLRTTLLSRSETAPPPPRPVPTINEEPAPPPPPSPPNAGLQAGFGVLWSPRGGGEAYQLWMTIHRFIVRPLGIALDVSAAHQPRNHQRPRGFGHRGHLAGGRDGVLALRTPGLGAVRDRRGGRGGDSPRHQGQRGAPRSSPARTRRHGRGLRARRRRLRGEQAGCASARARSRASCRPA